jgi:cytochrome c oxidase subunit 2
MLGVSAMLAGALLVAGAFGQQPAPAAPSADNAQVVEMTAKKYEYNPAEIRVKKGSKVELRIKALDRTHGFKIDPYPKGSDKKGTPGLVFSQPQDSWKLEKEQVRTIAFTAKEAGTYDFRCSLFCGFGHMGMKGKLIVEP